MAGYSSTPLVRKLGIKPGDAVALLHAPSGFELDVDGNVRDSLRGRAPFDVILAFFHRGAVMRRRLPAMTKRVTRDGGLWIAWPKKASGIATDLAFDVVQRAGLGLGLVDNKICAVDETWSALRFVVRVRDRRG